MASTLDFVWIAVAGLVAVVASFAMGLFTSSDKMPVDGKVSSQHSPAYCFSLMAICNFRQFSSRVPLRAWVGASLFSWRQRGRTLSLSPATWASSNWLLRISRYVFRAFAFERKDWSASDL